MENGTIPLPHGEEKVDQIIVSQSLSIVFLQGGKSRVTFAWANAGRRSIGGHTISKGSSTKWK